MATESINQVDIKEVFASKNPKLAKLIPGFIFRYIKRIIHEDFINEFLKKYGDQQGIDFVNASIQDFNITLEIKGKENIPKEGRYIFAANHPLGGFDGLLLMYILAKHNLEVRFLANDILNNIKNLEPLFLPVNKHGGNTREFAIMLDKTYNSDIQILTFPAGLVSRKIKGVIKDLEWQKNFIIKAKQYKRNVIPVHFSGKNSNFFYNLGIVRKKLGIKTNLEMFYLVDETYNHRNKHITVTFGKPVSYTTFNTDRKPIEWAALMREHIYKIQKDENTPLMG